MKTKAAILVELNHQLILDDIHIPDLKRGQVLVKIGATGVCGSQLGEISGVKGPDNYLPHLLGHEAGGIVEEIGEGVTTVQSGDHVVLHWKPSSGLEADCPKYAWGSREVNAGRVTTFQNHTIVSENRVTPISKDIPFDIAALYGCCLTTGFGVIENDADVNENENVVIMGVGGVGLTEVIAARIRKAKRIIAVDLSEDKLQMAQKLGATHIVQAESENVRDKIAQILNGDTLDVVIENTGNVKVIEMSYEVSGPKARVILVGVPRAGQKVNIYTLPLHFGKILKGSHGGGTKPEEDIERIMKLIQAHNVNLEAFVDKKYTLDNINVALDDLKNQRVIRPIIEFN